MKSPWLACGDIVSWMHMEICDIYIDGAHAIPELRFVRVFDKSFSYVEGKVYSRYIGASLPRLKGVLIVSRLKASGIPAFNLPIRYRSADLPMAAAHRIALEKAEVAGMGLSNGDAFRDIHTPMYWSFSIIDPTGDLVGGRIMVDRLDGHIWNLDEHETFMYDYNNVLG